MKAGTGTPRNSLPGSDDITRVELPNGITVMARPNFNSPSVVLSGYLPGGSMYDPLDRLGLAQFTAMTLNRGTRKYSFQQFFGSLEAVGASLGFGASVHNVSIGGRSLAEDLPLMLELVAEGLRFPVFPEEYVERLRGQLLTSLAIRAQDTGDMASLTFDSLLFPDHPYGRPEEGYTETVKKITRDDLATFHASRYSPRGMVIVVVGGVEPQRAVDEVVQALGGWSGPDTSQPLNLPPVKRVNAPLRRHVHIAGKSQCDLLMGSHGPNRNSTDYLPATLGNSVLGQFGMMGRIGDVVREQAGLAYYASTSLNAWIASGSWEVTAGVNPANLDRAVDLIQSELRRFTTEPVTQDELSDSQANFIGRLPLSLESNGGVANAMLNLERFQLGLDYYRQFPDMVRAVTPEQILETAQRYIDPDRLVVVSAGTLAP